MAQSSLSISDPLLMSFSQLTNRGEVMQVAQSAANDIAKRCGVEISLVPMDAQREKEFLLSGEIDGVFARVVGLEFTVPGLVRVPESTASFPVYAYAKRKDIVINGWDSLKAYKVTYLTDHLFFKLNFDPVLRNAVSFANIESAVKFVDAGRADIFVHAPLGVESALAIGELKNSGVKALQPAIDLEHTYIHVLPKHSKLVACFDVALKNMKADGTHQKLVNRLFLGS